MAKKFLLIVGLGCIYTGLVYSSDKGDRKAVDFKKELSQMNNTTQPKLSTKGAIGYLIAQAQQSRQAQKTAIIYIDIPAHVQKPIMQHVKKLWKFLKLKDTGVYDAGLQNYKSWCALTTLLQSSDKKLTPKVKEKVAEWETEVLWDISNSGNVALGAPCVIPKECADAQDFSCRIPLPQGLVQEDLDHADATELEISRSTGEALTTVQLKFKNYVVKTFSIQDHPVPGLISHITTHVTV